jgi:hypothetical protein
VATARCIGRIALVRVVAGAARSPAAAELPAAGEAPRGPEDRASVEAKRPVDPVVRWRAAPRSRCG